MIREKPSSYAWVVAVVAIKVMMHMMHRMHGRESGAMGYILYMDGINAVRGRMVQRQRFGNIYI